MFRENTKKLPILFTFKKYTEKTKKLPKEIKNIKKVPNIN